MIFHLLLLLLTGCSRRQNPGDGLILSVYDTDDRILRQWPLETYVQGAVSEEMPARFHEEALKCQAVAARTYAVQSCRAMGGSGCASYPEADLCTNSACCQGYLSPEERRERWGTEYAAMNRRIASAVAATKGVILTYGGMPAELLYHACSGGVTEDASAVFSHAAPYLISVQSPGEEESSAYSSTLTLMREEAAEKLRSAFPGCGVDAASLPAQLRLLSSTSSGRMDQVLIGSKTVSGAELRQALGLRSTMCTWECTEDSITFYVKGYGHGVGMSQYGANAMASRGSDWKAILQHYYPGTTVTSLDAYTQSSGGT